MGQNGSMIATIATVPPLGGSFGRSLGFQLRRPMTFSVGEPGRPERWRTVWGDGPGLLRTDLDARLTLKLASRGLQLGERTGPADSFLDAFALALGSCPPDDSARSWSDQLDARLLPGSGWLTFLSPVTHSVYHRRFERGRWIQTGAHRGIWSMIMTRAEISEEAGLEMLELHCEGVRRLCAHA